MGAQKLRRAALGIARQLLQFFKKRGHRARVVAGPGEHPHPDTVGLFFVHAGEVDPVLRVQAADAGDGGRPRVSVGNAHQDRPEQGGGGRQPVTAGLFKLAREMALGHVGNLMGHDPGHLAFIVRVQDNAAVHPDHAARPGKGVNPWVIDHKEGKGLARVIAVRGEALAE